MFVQFLVQCNTIWLQITVQTSISKCTSNSITFFSNYLATNVFCDIFAKGDLETPQDVGRLTFLARLSDLSWIVCRGVDNYSSYNVYGIKDAINVTIPPDTVRHKSCEKFFQCGKAHKPNLCQYCLSLKYYLTCKKITLSSDDAHLRCQSIHSTCSSNGLLKSH